MILVHADYLLGKSMYLQVAAKAVGEVAETARKDIEKRIGKRVVSKDNFLPNK